MIGRDSTLKEEAQRWISYGGEQRSWACSLGPAPISAVKLMGTPENTSPLDTSKQHKKMEDLHSHRRSDKHRHLLITFTHTPKPGQNDITFALRQLL